jgi:drug/metabolite transporter (DMT)-like permease
MTIAAARALIAAPLVLGFLRLSGGRLPPLGSAWKPLLLVGVLGAAIPFAAIAWGQEHIASGLGGILLGTIPIFSGELAVSALVFLLPTLAMGATFTYIAQGARDKTGLGVAPGGNTLGAACAPFLFGVLLLPVLGSKTTLILLSLGYLLLIQSHSGLLMSQVAVSTISRSCTGIGSPGSWSMRTCPSVSPSR